VKKLELGTGKAMVEAIAIEIWILLLVFFAFKTT